MPRLTLALLCAAVALAVSTSSAAASARTCDVGNTRGYGTTYVTAIAAKSVSCAKAKKVVKAFHACRPGKAGRCTERVSGYACTERRYNSSPQSYDADVTCRKGGKKVTHTYTQFI